MFSYRRMAKFAALESVDFQDRSFGDRIRDLTSEIIGKLETGVVTSKDLPYEPEIKLLEDHIFKNKGLRVKLVTNSELAAILPFYPNKNSIFIDEFFRGNFTIESQEKILRESNGRKGTVDLKKGKVGGLFSEGTSILYINFYALLKTFGATVGEITAFILHELGHAFSACEYSDRVTRTNQVLASASREIFKKEGKKDVDYIYTELKKVNGETTIEQVDKIVNGNRIVGGVLWNKFLIETVAQEMRNDKYSDNSFEQLSDNFASRHGYGKEIVTGLDKLHNAAGSLEKNTFMRRTVNVLTLIYLIYLPFMVIASVTVAPVFGILYTAIMMYVFYTSGDAKRDNTYDELRQRYVRVRADLITFLKDPSVPKKKVEEIVGQIKTMDTIIANTADDYGPWRALSNILISSNREARRDINYQKMLEGTVNNDLFAAAAQVRTL